MKILFGSPFRAPFDNGRMIAEALRKAGAHVVHFDARNGDVPPKAHDADLSLILKCTRSDEVFRAHPGRRIVIFPDALDRSPHLHDHLQQYDRVLSCNDPGPYTWAEFFPLGWSETLNAVQPRPAPSYPALFCGTNNSPGRLAFVRALKNSLAGALAINGNNWPPELHARPPVYYEDYVILLSRAKVIVNRHESPVGPNLRCFEAPQCAPMIVDKARGVNRIFSPNLLAKCSYENADDALRLIQYLNFAPDEALALRRAQAAATEDFSYERQMAKFVEEETK